LTDPVLKENYEIFGNPDGPKPRKISIALPSFVLNKKNHMTILFLFLLTMVIIPLGLLKLNSCFTCTYYTGNYYTYSKIEVIDISNENHIESLKIMLENIQLIQMPFILGCSKAYNFVQLEINEQSEIIEVLILIYISFIIIIWKILILSLFKINYLVKEIKKL